jgi:hypothetical protein
MDVSVAAGATDEVGAEPTVPEVGAVLPLACGVEEESPVAPQALSARAATTGKPERKSWKFMVQRALKMKAVYPLRQTCTSLEGLNALNVAVVTSVSLTAARSRRRRTHCSIPLSHAARSSWPHSMETMPFWTPVPLGVDRAMIP